MRGKMLVTFNLNGCEVSLAVRAEESLLNALRRHGCTDLKCGCEAGSCGSCALLLDGLAVKSCIIPAASVNGKQIWTAAALCEYDTLAKSLAESFIDCGAIQCGFCTPGMIIASYAYIKDGGKADRQAIRRALSGNLCRCTGYKKIVDAVEKVAGSFFC